MAEEQDLPAIGQVFSDGAGVIVSDPKQAERLHKRRLGGGFVPESDSRLPTQDAIAAILTCEEANLALHHGWLHLSPDSHLLHRPLFQTIFRDLWERGMWITTGMKFGADMLAYLQMPGVVHSSYIVLVCEQRRQLNVLDLITVGRLATAVNKKVVVASVNESSDEIQYSTMEWDQATSNPPRSALSLAELDEALDTI